MSSCQNACIDITSYFSDSEGESLFQVKRPSVHRAAINQFPINKRILRRNASWSYQEKKLYVGFLKSHFDLMERPSEERRDKKAYWLMASSIGSRNYAQCRIHHSRMLQRCRSLENLIRACEQELKRADGTLEKMQQYGLRVQLDEEQEQQCRVKESELWMVLETSQHSYFQNEPSL